MLQLVDTAIAFAVVMLLLSLLITTVVQVILAALDLRGRNLAWHIEMLLNQVYPEFRKNLKDLCENRKSEDHAAAAKDIGSAAKAPKQKEQDKTAAEVIADAVVTHPAVAQGAKGITWTSRAKAITSDELVAVLKDLASPNPAATLEETARRALKKYLEENVDTSGETLALVSAVKDEFNKQHLQITDQLEKLITQTARKVTRLEQNVEQWFDTVMSRSGDVFTRYTQAITIGAAVLIAFFFQIDARQIAQQLYTNAEIRSSFVKMADDVTARADKILENSMRGKQAAERLVQKEKDEAAKSDKVRQEAKASSPEANQAEADMTAHQNAAKLLARAPEDLGNCGAADTWLAAQKDASQDLRNRLQQTCQDVTNDAMGAAGKQIKEISDQLQHSDLRITSWGDSYWNSYRSLYHCLGILATMALLSLGAPFWFNTLRELANLKPTIATTLSQQESATESAPSAKVNTEAKATGASAELQVKTPKAVG